MATKLLNLIALSSLVVLLSSFGPTPINALSIDTSPNVARSLGHAAIAKKRRAPDSRRCKPRPSSSSVHSSAATTTPAPTSVRPPPTTTPPPPPPPKTTTAPNNNGSGGNTGNNNGGGGGGSSKACLAWPNGDSISLRGWKTPKVRTVYTWSPWKPANSDQLGFQFAPMLWGTKQINAFTSLVKPGYANVALGFNEPDHPGQAEMDAGQAADVWRRYLAPLKNQGYYLVSPATTSAPKGKTWLRDFMNACSGCNVDAIALHWYGTDAQAFIAYVEDFYNTFKKPIWVTEVACQSFSGGPQCNAGQISAFMNTITGWMDSTWYVERYCWFGAMPDLGNVNVLNGLMQGNGQPNGLGQNYIN